MLPAETNVRDIQRLIREYELPVSPQVGGRNGRTKSNIINDLRSHFGQEPLPVPVEIAVAPHTPMQSRIVVEPAATLRLPRELRLHSSLPVP